MNKNDAGYHPLEALARLETDPDLSEGEGRQLADHLHLDESLRPLTENTREEHLSLPVLRGLAEEHRRRTGEKDIPEHLAICPICLDLFQSLLEGVPAVARGTLKRFENLVGASSSWWPQGWFTSKPGLLRVAAIVVILLGAGVLCKSLIFSNPPVAVNGVFTLANGVAVPAGANIPSSEPFTMNAGAALALNDGGTSVRAESSSEISFSRSFFNGDPRFMVHGGDVWVTAAKQKPGSSIVVQTALGEIQVIGTAFRVTVESEPVVVYERLPKASEVKRYDSIVSAVIVVVQEGTVALRNRHEQVAVSAGQTAIMRKGLPRIELR